jgi:ABC-2 type transport system ATP-binding protein
VVEDKNVLMRKLGKRQLILTLQQPLNELPAALGQYPLELSDGGHALVFTFDASRRETGIPGLLRRLSELNIDVKDLHSSESSLEDIFVGLVRARA